MPTGPEIVASAQKHMGAKYVYGSAGPRTFDCSGLVQYVYREFGISLPHHAADQAKRGTSVSTDDIQPGDLVFSNWGDGPNSHVGIAVSKNQIIDAPHTGAVVRYDSLSSGYLKHVTAVRRMTGVTNASSGAGTAGTGVSSASNTQGSTGATAAGTDTVGSDTGGAASSSGDSSSGGLFGGIADAIKTALRPLTALQTLADMGVKAFLPTSIIRVVCGILGLVFIAWGTILMAREVK